METGAIIILITFIGILIFSIVVLACRDSEIHKYENEIFLRDLQISRLRKHVSEEVFKQILEESQVEQVKTILCSPPYNQKI